MNIFKAFESLNGSFQWIEGSIILCDETKKSISSDSELTMNQTVSKKKARVEQVTRRFR